MIAWLSLHSSLATDVTACRKTPWANSGSQPVLMRAAFRLFLAAPGRSAAFRLVRMIVFRHRAFAAIASMLVLLPACTAGRQQEPASARPQFDIHERLGEVIARDGFTHVLRTERDDMQHHDVINISVSLDSLKGRHHSLEKLMTDIGRVCAHPSYAHLPIRILIGAGDDDDQMYLYAILATAVKGAANVGLLTAPDSRNQIVISVRHPGWGDD